MPVKYWIGDFFIDLSRNQITRKEQHQTIAPKALAVLTFLAKNQGKVVSYDELLSEIWPNTVVTPNTLQRSIAQLRKALGENSKVQSYIKTHAKQGYSLECDVKWDIKNELQSLQEHKLEIEAEVYPDLEQSITQELDQNHQLVDEVATGKKLEPSKPIFKIFFAILGLVILIGISVDFFTSKQASLLSFDTLRSLTATDDKEFNAIYTPNGKFIIFNRYIGKLCTNNIWAKNLKTQQEIQLTKNLGSYSGHNLSSDGKTLIFIETEDCRKSLTQKRCYDLRSLDFEKALITPQIPGLILQCKNSEIRKPTWLNNSDIALFQKSFKRWKLIRYSLSKNKSADLYELKSGNLINFAYSTSENLIAITSIHDDGGYYIDMLTPNGELVSSHKIKYSQELPKFRPINPVFDPLNKQLIFSSGEQLFSLTYDGEINKINFPFNDVMGSPRFHPEDEKLLLIKGRYDSDIASIPRVESPKTDQSPVYSTIERSIVGEQHGLFQPNGKLIAFLSERSGKMQVWTTDGNRVQQLSDFPIDTRIRGLEWAQDGQSLLVNNNNELTQLSLDSSQLHFPFEHAIIQLFQWDSKNNTALLIVRIKGVSTFVEYNLTTSISTVINENRILWALKSKNGQLIYSDHMNRFWQPGPTEDLMIEELNGKNKLSRFVMKDNVIYGVNNESQLWSYDLEKRLFKILREMPENIDYLTDINDTQLLLEVRISAKKEVVELYSIK
jgi:DNA-binding winged helix-turn-helix (wHTH) protein/Tol biopolymer transport system component